MTWLVVVLLTPIGKLEDTGWDRKKKIINLILNVLLHYIECLSTMYVQLTFGKWPHSWKLKNMNSGVYKMSTIISTSRVHIED